MSGKPTGNPPGRPLTTHCPAGHERTEENTYTYLRAGYVQRKCKPCARAQATMQRHALVVLQQKWARIRAARGY